MATTHEFFEDLFALAEEAPPAFREATHKLRAQNRELFDAFITYIQREIATDAAATWKNRTPEQCMRRHSSLAALSLGTVKEALAEHERRKSLAPTA